jgi:hypothetical protein
MKVITLISLLIGFGILSAFSQDSKLENNEWELCIDDLGNIKSIHYKESGNTFKFYNESFRGPSWYLNLEDTIIEPRSKQVARNRFETSIENVDLSLEYIDENGKLLIVARIVNNQNVPFQPNKLGLRLGVDTYMDHYPDWEEKVFPTLLRCESTHFWGYFMGTTGKILVIGSPDAIASWSHDYSKSWGTPPYQYNGHRITSVNLDLINELPLPKRHPQNLWQILPGETKTFRIYLEEVNSLNHINETVSEITQAPTIDIQHTTCTVNEKMDFSVLSDDYQSVNVCSPNGVCSPIMAESKDGGISFYSYTNTKIEGLYTVRASGSNGKYSEACFYVRKPYGWYMQRAMQAVIDYPQKASTSHCESWYGFYTAFAGGKHFPNAKMIPEANDQFAKIFPIVFDINKFEPVAIKHRIQNVSSMIGILTDRYELFRDENDLRKALKLSDYLLQAQTPDGAYRAGNTHYTSVIYIAKSLMELLDVIEPLREKPEYASYYQRIYSSVEKAMNELVINKSDIQTEGEQTFEDGMIACSALQLGQFALMQSDYSKRENYIEAATELLTQHQCLEQLIIPDARMRSSSLRFWEAQYDVMMDNNFFNSPHGWSSWSTYANYYLYLLTYDVKYLVRAFNGLDAAMQMINLEGELRWAFAVNPYLKVTQINTNLEGATPLDFKGIHYHAKQYPNSTYVIGEQYVNMVSDWFFPNANDNDVHEHFKCLEEIALNKAYVAENPEGEIVCFNCSVSVHKDEIFIKPNESIIDRVHINIKPNTMVVVEFDTITKKKKIKEKGIWITELSN